MSSGNSIQDINIFTTLRKISRTLIMNSKPFTVCSSYLSDLATFLGHCYPDTLASLSFLKHSKHMYISVNVPPTDICRVCILTSPKCLLKRCFLNILYDTETLSLHLLTLDHLYHCVTYYYNFLYL